MQRRKGTLRLVCVILRERSRHAPDPFACTFIFSFGLLVLFTSFVRSTLVYMGACVALYGLRCLAIKLGTTILT